MTWVLWSSHRMTKGGNAGMTKGGNAGMTLLWGGQWKDTIFHRLFYRR